LVGWLTKTAAFSPTVYPTGLNSDRNFTASIYGRIRVLGLSLVGIYIFVAVIPWLTVIAVLHGSGMLSDM
jgi:hypothetical protein